MDSKITADIIKGASTGLYLGNYLGIGLAIGVSLGITFLFKAIAYKNPNVVTIPQHIVSFGKSAIEVAVTLGLRIWFMTVVFSTLMGGGVSLSGHIIPALSRYFWN